MRGFFKLIATLAMLWCLGFALFMLSLPKPLEGNTTDAIVVPTGGAGRIDRGIALLKAHQARRMLVTGVGPGVGARDLAREYDTSPRWFDCCIDLGTDAVDTRSNAAETAAWVRAHSYRTVRLVSSDWHVPRAKMELAAALGPGVIVMGDGVPGSPRLGTLVNEYNKFLLRRVGIWMGFAG
jgi:uncharacterized SAM-binding protein YcdF (DUF218 family)